VAALPAFGQYTVDRQGDVVRLRDASHQTEVGVLASRGNMGFQMTVKGKKAVYFPFNSVEEFLGGRGGMAGIPFLGPWANRLDGLFFYANGKKYNLNMDLGNVRGGRDNHPMHGFLSNEPWEIVEAKADNHAAWVTSKLEFYKHPQYMAQWPFAHTLEMTYRLQDGTLEVSTSLHNLSVEPMPVMVGFHSFYQVNDAPRDEWTFGVAAHSQWVTDAGMMPTGEKRPIEQLLPKPQGGSLKGLALDNLFGDMIRDSSGKATSWVQGKQERVEVSFGPKYTAMVIYSPGGGRDFICFEPMPGITNAMNLAQKGTYKDLQSVPPGGTWQESFWVKTSGF
jgi:aldose 1-epimerase